MESDLPCTENAAREQGIRRRTVVKGAAWTAPVVLASMAAPAFAVSINVAITYVGCTTVTHELYTWARLTFTVVVSNTTIPVGALFTFGAVDHPLALPLFAETRYGGTLSSYVKHTGGTVECSQAPCNETLTVQAPIPAGTYTLTVDVAVETNPTTVRLSLPGQPGETTTADNSATDEVHLSGAYTTCGTG